MNGAGFQLPLNIGLRDDATLANYYPGANVQVLAAVQRLGARVGERVLYLWGGRGAGKSHLLQAACHAAHADGAAAAYLPLIPLMTVAPAVLDGLERLDVVCVDDLDAAAGNDAWETALFHLFNRCRDAGACLAVAGRQPPAALPLQLPDLSSRIGGALVFHVHALDDAQLAKALQMRAARRGLELPDDVAEFLLRRCRRDMTSLYAVLDRLDRASLAAQRRLTIPFVRQWL